MRAVLAFLVLMAVSACQTDGDGYYSPLADAGLYANNPAMVVTIEEAMHGSAGGHGMVRAATPSGAQGSMRAPGGLYAVLDGSVSAVAPMVQPAPHNAREGSEAASSTHGMTSALYALHLASFSDPASISGAVSRLRGQGLAEISGLEARVEKVNLGPDRGWYHRVKMGPVPSEADARARCTALERAGVFCKVTNFSGVAIAP
jgi:cell division septation protein DedD